MSCYKNGQSFKLSRLINKFQTDAIHRVLQKVSDSRNEFSLEADIFIKILDDKSKYIRIFVDDLITLLQTILILVNENYMKKAFEIPSLLRLFLAKVHIGLARYGY